MALKLAALFCFMTAFKIGCIDAFRSEYTFIESTQSYYKLYKEKTKWTEAKTMCESEGAVLFHPDNKAELVEVLKVLAIGNNGGYRYINTGISNLESVDVFKTVDGRPVSQVYNNWSSGDPRACTKNGCRCVFLDINDHALVPDPCSVSFPYICKHKTPAAVQTIIDNANLKIADLERQLTNLSAALVVLVQLTTNQTAQLEALEQLTTNQSAQLEALEQLTTNQSAQLEALEQQRTTNQSAELERLKVNQTKKSAAAPMQLQDANHSVSKGLMEVVANQAAALEQLAAIQAAVMLQQKETTKAQVTNQPSLIDRLTEAVVNQATTVKLLVAKQAAAMDRQALVMEKLGNLQGDNNEVSERSEQ